MTHTEREPQPSDAELEARADDLYTAIMAALDSLPAATWTPEYREAKRKVQAMEIEFRAVCLELSTRLHARAVAWNELPDVTR